jgi:hypothetical protein
VWLDAVDVHIVEAFRQGARRRGRFGEVSAAPLSRRRPIRQAPVLAQFSRIFLREAALGSSCGPGLPGTNGVSGLAVQQLQLSARVS